MSSIFSPLGAGGTASAPRRPRRWRQAWDGSLRFRLLALGLMPLLLAFPAVLGVLIVVGGERAQAALHANLKSNLAAAGNYLEMFRSETGLRIAQLVKAGPVSELVRRGADGPALEAALRTAAESGGLDYLAVVTADGRVVASSLAGSHDRRVPDSHAVAQARIGVATAAIEHLGADALDALAPGLAARSQVPVAGGGPARPEAGMLVVNAAAHFPLAVGAPDAVLVGGVVVNRNASLIEHLRQIVYPVGSLPDEAEGHATLYVGDVNVTTSRMRMRAARGIGTVAPAEVAARVLRDGERWIGRRSVDGVSQTVAYEPIVDGQGRRIGMLAVGFPDAPYLNVIWVLIGVVAAALALTMLAISLLFLRVGHDLTRRLNRIAATMTAVRRGDRDARVGPPEREDELGRLARHFDELLNTIAEQDQAQRAAQQTIADEASRRRALFEKERDGVVILNPDGSVFEANPRCATMLGYTPQELRALRVTDWDLQVGPEDIARLLDRLGEAGGLFETTHRRRDGSTYDAEVAVSRAQWGDRTFVLLLLRDISERKAVTAELAHHRRHLQALVDERTKQLHDRNGQLDAIFALSPDGFVSFDSERRVRFVNRAFLRMTGVAEDELLGLDEDAFSERLARRGPEASRFPGLAALRDAPVRAPGTGAAAAEAAGLVFELAGPPHRVLKAAVRVSAAANVSQVLYLRDVTHETEVDRMKSEFLSTAAHELRTPMTSIFGFVNLLRARAMGDERRRDILDTVARQSELMIAIVNQLLDLARIEARQGSDFVLRTLPLQDLVAETVAAYRPPGGREAPQVDAAEAPMPVRVDPQKIQQALLNILSNAYKYSPGGGAVRVRLRGGGGERPRCGIEVVDEGIGMTPEQCGHVFERFYRADASGSIPGTGLGMSIVKEIVELHGGRVELRSRPGAGTAVTLWLPADAQPQRGELPSLQAG